MSRSSRAPQLGHLRPLRGHQPVNPHALVALGLLDPLPHGRLGEVQVPDTLPPDRVGTSTRAHTVSLERVVTMLIERGE